MALWAGTFSPDVFSRRTADLAAGDAELEERVHKHLHGPDINLLEFLSRLKGGEVDEGKAFEALGYFVEDAKSHIQRLLALPDDYYRTGIGNAAIRTAYETIRDLLNLYGEYLNQSLPSYSRRPDFPQGRLWDDVAGIVIDANLTAREGIRDNLHDLKMEADNIYSKVTFLHVPGGK